MCLSFWEENIKTLIFPLHTKIKVGEHSKLLDFDTRIHKASFSSVIHRSRKSLHIREKYQLSAVHLTVFRGLLVNKVTGIWWWMGNRKHADLPWQCEKSCHWICLNYICEIYKQKGETDSRLTWRRCGEFGGVRINRFGLIVERSNTVSRGILKTVNKLSRPVWLSLF